MKLKTDTRRFSFEHQVLAYFLLVVLIVVSIVGISRRIRSEAVRNRTRVAHTQAVMERTDSLQGLQRDLVMGVRGYLLTGDSAFLQGSARGGQALREGVQQLRRWTRDNPRQQSRLDSIAALLDRFAAVQRDLLTTGSRPLVAAGEQLLEDQQRLFAALQAEERDLLARRRAAYEEAVRQEALAVRLLLGVFVLSLLLAFWVVYRNTVKRNRAEAALRRNKRLIRDIIESAPVLVNVKDLEGRYLLVNRQFAWALNTSPDELIGKTSEGFMAPGTAAAIRAEDEEVVRTGAPSEVELQLPGPDGDHSYITSKFPLFDEGGVLYAIGSTSADITPIKQAHERLMHAYAQQQRILNGLQAVLSASSDMICITNEEGAFVMVSDTARELLGYEPKELMSKRFLDFVAAEDRERTWQVALDVISGRPVTEFTNHYRRKDGRLVPVIWAAKWLSEDCLMYCIARNGTERQRTAEQLAQSQARLAHAQTIARMGNWEWDLVHNEWSCSDEVYTLLGIPKEEGIDMQQALLAAIHPEDREQLYKAREAALTKGTKIDLEHRIVRSDGEVCYMYTIGEVTVDDRGQPVWFSGTLQDITQRKQAELALQQLNADLKNRAAELRASNAELERFAYVASHDLQEPLRMVSSFLSLLTKRLQGQLDEPAQQYIHFAVDGAERMKRLIGDLLQYSRLNSLQAPLVAVHLDEVWEQVARTFTAELEATGGVLTSDALPVVHGVFSQLTQLVQNLVGNALKYRGDAPPEVHLHCTEQEDGWLFCLRDNGMGIDPKFFDKIFIIFQRLHHRADFPGTGIGLAVCKKIVERHGGTIWVASEPGQGSRFYFTLKKPHHA